MDGISVGGDGNMSDKVERGHLERGGISGTCKKKARCKGTSQEATRMTPAKTSGNSI